MRRSRRAHALAFAALLFVCCASGCTPPPAAPTRATWLAAAPAPAFDPHGPSDPLRESLERAVGRGLTDLDSSDAVLPALAEHWQWSADRCTLRFVLRGGLRFADDSLVTAAHVREALLAGLARTDHRRSTHLLAAVRGVGVRPRRGAPPAPIGIEAPDARSLVFTLTRPDSLLPAKLALPGVSTPWHVTGEGWEGAAGCGPYRVLRAEGARALWLVRRTSGGMADATVDTLEVRFEPSAARVRARLRDASVDAVWPLPPPLLAGDPPPGYALVRWATRPERRLVLVLRQDRPPLTRPDRRRVLLRAAEGRGLAEALGPSASAVREWVPGGGATAPLRPPAVRREGAGREQAAGPSPESARSFHVHLGFDADGAAARLAPRLEERFGAAGVYVEPMPLRGDRRATRLRAIDGPEAMLVEVQTLFPGAAEALAPFAESETGVPLGGFRTGWRPRDLAGALVGAEPLDPALARLRLEEAQSVLPIARLDGSRLARVGSAGARSHPRFGLEYTDLRRGGSVDFGH